MARKYDTGVSVILAISRRADRLQSVKRRRRPTQLVYAFIVVCAISMCNVVLYAAPDGTSPLHTMKQSSAQTSAASPRLVIDAGGHRAIIRELLFTQDGHELISVSDDKTIRVWTIPPDGRRAMLARTLRGHIDDGRAGQLAAAALSPPDATGHPQWLAVGGFLAGPLADRHAVRLHDYPSGEVRALLRGHTDLVLSLAFSPTGRWLASAGKDHSIRIWDLEALQSDQLTKAPLVLQGHTDHIYDLDWSAMGTRLASASYDHTVHLWNTERLAQDRVTRVARLRGHKHHVATVAFHPEGRVLASGGKDATIRLWRAEDGKSLGVFARSPNQVASLVFSPNGHLLLAGRSGGHDAPKRIVLYAYPSGTPQHEFTGHDNIVLATAFHPNSRWIASGGGDQKTILLWDATTGGILSRLAGGGRTIWAVGFAKDGRTFSWGQTFEFTSELDRGSLEHRFDLSKLEVLKGGIPAADAVRANDHTNTLKLITKRRGDVPSRLVVQQRQLFGKQLMTLERDHTNGYQHSAYTLSPKGRYILSGGFNGALTLYSLEGDRRAQLIGHTGEIKAVAVSADERLAVSGASDQTVKLWSLVGLPEDGPIAIHPTLTLFPASNDEWVAWNPEGYFKASPNGTNLAGYSLNRGVHQLAAYISFDQLYDRFYRPDKIHHKIKQTLSGQPQTSEDNKKKPIESTLQALPPTVTFVSPDTPLTVHRPDISIRVEIADQGGGIGKVEWRVNGVTVHVHRQLQAENDVIELIQPVTLGLGENTLHVTAYNQHNDVASASASLTLTFQGEPSPSAGLQEVPPVDSETHVVCPGTPTRSVNHDRPALYLIAVGINQYQHKALRLRYAVSDVEALVKVFCQKSKPLFHKIVIQKVLNHRATLTNIEAVFANIAAQAQPHDVFILFLAGHGVTRDGRYYFLPQDFPYRHENSVYSTAVTQDHLQQWLSSVPARKSLVLIDTCESGSVSWSQAQLRVPSMAKPGSSESRAVLLSPASTTSRGLLSNTVAQEASSPPLALRLDRGLLKAAGETRFMNMETAAAQLVRATGRATIVASTARQGALEGIQGHGAFTYVLLQGLSRADAMSGNGNGITSYLELAQFVDHQVPKMTKQEWGYEQLPQMSLVGSDFPIAVVGTQ